MICGFCRKEFDEKQAQPACKNCAMHGGCKLMRCPHCGYEMPPEPGLIRWLRKLIGGRSRQ